VINNRNGERGAPPVRALRFFKMGHYWYFTTREGASIGPFDDRERAETGARGYAEQIRDLPETAELIRHYA
jgi:hypothetical protein